MSDAAPDPIDKAYAQAEAVLNDEAARAARRARVLAAAAAAQVQATPPPEVSSAPAWRGVWRRGGWLAASVVAGLSVVVATQVHPPASVQRPVARVTQAAPAPPAAAAGVVSSVAREPAPAPARASKAAAPIFAAAPPAAKLAPADVRMVQPAPPPPPPPSAQVAQAPEAVPAAPAAPPADGLSELVVTAQRRTAADTERAAGRAQPAPVTGSLAARAFSAREPAAKAAVSPPDLAAQLRAAATAGRTGEVTSLLAKGAPIEGIDAEGDTALMKAIRANQPAAVRLLVRRGADPDRRNHAGESARDMARAVGDAKLNRALDLEP